MCMHAVVFTKKFLQGKTDAFVSLQNVCLCVYRCRCMFNDNNKSIYIYKAQNLVRRDCSKHTHAHKEAPACMSMLTIQNLIYTQLQMGSKRRLGMCEDSSTEQKTWVCGFGKGNVLRFMSALPSVV